ncbi:hypothetical protein C5686_013375 [Serratia liquefaciens]|nr:hypothetical protein C5686_013375 [Serratia liquefaciens]
MVITEQIDNSPKNSRKFYGWISADAMIEYAIFAKNYSTGGRQAGQKKRAAQWLPMVNRKVKLI